MSAADPPPTAPPPPLPEDETDLWPRVAGGDRAAAERLVEITYRKIWASLFKLTGGDADLAADLTQEAYRKAWAALPRFDGRSRFSTWVYRIAYNTFLSHVQRPQRLTPLDERQAKGLRDRRPSPVRSTMDSAAAERLRRAVLGLPEELRLAVTARFWAEMPVREIARLQGITPMGVRKRLKRAHRILAMALEEQES